VAREIADGDKLQGFTPHVHHTPAGTPYLTECGLALVSRTESMIDGYSVGEFLDGFDDELGFDKYLEDPYTLDSPSAVAKFAGQLCYLSFGEKRTWNVDAEKYFRHILESGHGSVLEHVNFGFLIWGADRSFTHELVRKRVGVGYSQVSQRYVDGKTLRFVERVEFQADDVLHQTFMDRIDGAAAEYDAIAERLRETMSVDPVFVTLPRTEQRKRVNQAARACLPNETEAPIMMTGNARAWRDLIEQRASKHTDRPIRSVAFRIARILQAQAPLLFGDYTLDHEAETASTPYRKV
jgi:thymidylate synthase (FAD)